MTLAHSKPNSIALICVLSYPQDLLSHSAFEQLNAFLFYLEPSKPPSTVTALNRSSTTILVKWSPIPKQSIHGMLLGYHIHFKSLDSVGFGIVSSRVQSTAANTTSSLIPGLLKFTDYSIQVSGFTVKGDGPLSKAVIVKTEEDGK